ncbi:MAG: hypothetical protein GY839_16145 [candidate division Zixibacteria bacterium]|nr:hypothetical protein [candidate division Zixibacteria bacterium]
MKIVGYMDGTNPEVLTNLFLSGIETLPLSNGWDRNGKYIAHISKNDNVSLIIGYLHKFFPLAKELDMGDMLSSVKINKIPLLFIVPKDKQEKAKKMLDKKGLKYKFADPKEISDVVVKILKPGKSKKKTRKRK